jgi:hypothetical protein
MKELESLKCSPPKGKRHMLSGYLSYQIPRKENVLVYDRMETRGIERTRYTN